MNKKIVISAGTPNDSNREYLPEVIKESDMVVNENGNNSQVYPVGLTEHTDMLIDGVCDTWYQYIPASYDGSKKVPLVISMHGGMMTGWGQAIYTSWTLVADREGFIVIFPNANKGRFWIVECEKKAFEIIGKPRSDGFYLQAPPKNPDDNHDMNCVLKLIERMKEKYNIDDKRIYMQGMSMGNMMTHQFTRYHGHVLAGAAGSAGMTWPEVIFDEQGEVINHAGPLDVWQSRCEHDSVAFHEEDEEATDYFVKKGREYWKIINKCNALPQIKINGEDNFAFYKGEYADFVFRDIYNRDHGQTFDDAELVWDYLFSGVSRDENGNIIHTKPISARRGDQYAIALAVGSAKAYVNNNLLEISGRVFKHQKLKYHGLNGGSIIRGEYFMVPISFISKVYGAGLKTSGDGCSAHLTLSDKRELQFARGIIGCVVDNKVCSMLCEAVLRDGELYIPIEWFCQYLFNNHVSCCNDVLYITDHYAKLSINMAHIIRDEILN